MKHRLPPTLVAPVVALIALIIPGATAAGAQDVLPSLPGYAEYARIMPQLPSAFTSGALNVSWAEDGASFEYVHAGKRYRYDLAARAARELGEATGDQRAGRFGGRGGRGRGAGPARGRQFTEEMSPDSAHVAFFKDDNLWVRDADGAHVTAVTTDGSASRRIKYGTASWVYGEELAQRTAFWWSPDGRKVAYYRFDESRVPDYYLQMSQTTLYDSVNTEAYPKPGVPNPTVDLFVYDLATGKTTRVDVRDGRPFENDVVGYYVYNVGWSPDGHELTMNRTNRRQNVMEFTGCDPDTGACHAIVRESWPTGWVQNRPYMRYLADGHRFIWESERTGFRNYYLYDLNGTLLSTITHHAFETAGVEDVDERAGMLYYMARDGDNYMKLQLHRVRLDGTGDVRLTDPKFNHRVTLSPDGRYFVDVAETHDSPPATRLMDANGKLVADLAASDTTPVRCARAQARGDVHLQGRRRRDHAARDDQFPVALRPGAAVPGAGGGLRRAGLGEQHGAGDVRAAQSPGRIRIPRRQSRFARRARYGQAAARRHLPQARADRDGRHGGGGEGAVEPSLRGQRARGDLRHVVRGLHVRSWNSCATPKSSPRRRRPRRPPTGATTTRSTPSATCGFRRRTRRGTSSAPPCITRIRCAGACSSTTEAPTTTCTPPTPWR